MSERIVIKGNAFMQNLYGIGSSARSGESPAGWPYGDLGFRIAQRRKQDRALRGASWRYPDYQCVSRTYLDPKLKGLDSGFRIAKRKI